MSQKNKKSRQFTKLPLNHKTVQRLMKELGLVCKINRCSERKVFARA